MIYQGSKGSLCLYYKGLLISSYALTEKKSIERYIQQGEELIYKSKGMPIHFQIKTYISFCNLIYTRKKNLQPIRRSDHIYFLNCLMALMRLRIIEEDAENGYMAFPKYRKKLS